jgi:predicted ArsR family transcriptional regulator
VTPEDTESGQLMYTCLLVHSTMREDGLEDAILLLLAQRGPQPVSELAKIFQWPLSVILDALHKLAADGEVQESQGIWTLK